MKVVSLFDYTGAMVEPWLEAGYDCWLVDTQHTESHEPGLHKIPHDLSVMWEPPFPASEIAFVAAFPPCDHLAVSGARWFKGKGLRALARSINLFASAAEFCEWSGAPYMIENPVSTISTYWREPDYKFHPCHFTLFEPADNYTKATCLWTGGGFRFPQRGMDLDLPYPDDRIHKAPPGTGRANFRSATPAGFARAVYEANK